LTKEIHRPEKQEAVGDIGLYCYTNRVVCLFFVIYLLYGIIFNFMFWCCCVAIVQWYQTPDKVKEIWLGKIVNW